MVHTTLMYCGALPLLYTFACTTCLLMYWCDKWLLLRGSRVPPPYDFRIAEAAAAYLPWAGVLHLVMTIYFFGEPRVFPAYRLSSFDDGERLGDLRSLGLGRTLLQRLDSTATVGLSLELLVVLCVILSSLVARLVLLTL